MIAFDEEIMPLLHQLAGELLQNEEYTRLLTIAQYLSVFAAGQWQRLGNDERAFFLEKMDNDFHVDAWEDYSESNDTIDSIKKLIRKAQLV